MSGLAAQGIGGSLPTVSPETEPAAIRNASPAVQHAYQAALGFEEMLLEELTHSLAATTALGGEGEEGEGAAGGGEAEGAGGAAGESDLISSLLPRTLAEGLATRGGIGIANELANELAGAQSATQGAGTAGATSGATAAPAAPRGSAQPEAGLTGSGPSTAAAQTAGGSEAPRPNATG